LGYLFEFDVVGRGVKRTVGETVGGRGVVESAGDGRGVGERSGVRERSGDEVGVGDALGLVRGEGDGVGDFRFALRFVFRFALKLPTL
jgi:hypothetical protein